MDCRNRLQVEVFGDVEYDVCGRVDHDFMALRDIRVANELFDELVAIAQMASLPVARFSVRTSAGSGAYTGTASTGQVARRTIRSVVLPRSASMNPWCPCVAMTIRSA